MVNQLKHNFGILQDKKIIEQYQKHIIEMHMEHLLYMILLVKKVFEMLNNGIKI